MKLRITFVMLAIALMAGLATTANAQRGGDRNNRGNNDRGSINDRQREQQRRIQQGVRDCSLTPHEAERLRNQEAKLRQLEERLRENGLTPKERERLQRDLDKLNREIYRQRHDRENRCRQAGQ